MSLKTEIIAKGEFQSRFRLTDILLEKSDANELSLFLILFCYRFSGFFFASFNHIIHNNYSLLMRHIEAKKGHKKP